MNWPVGEEELKKSEEITEALDVLFKEVYSEKKEVVASEDCLYRRRMVGVLKRALQSATRPFPFGEDKEDDVEQKEAKRAFADEKECLEHAEHIEEKIYRKYFFSDPGRYVARCKALEHGLRTNGYYLLTHFGPDVVACLPATKLAEGTPAETWRTAHTAKLLKDLHRGRRASDQAAAAAQGGVFECPKCHQNDTDYYPLQTRGADEPMTMFVTCRRCNIRFRR